MLLKNMYNLIATYRATYHMRISHKRPPFLSNANETSYLQTSEILMAIGNHMQLEIDSSKLHKIHILL